MIDPATGLAWGATDNYLGYICERVTAALRSMDVAAIIVQRWWRRGKDRGRRGLTTAMQKENRYFPPLATTPEVVWNELANEPITASIK